MTDTTQIQPSKPAATSLTLQGATVQLIVSLMAVLALLFPTNADKFNSFGQTVTGYAPVVGGVIAAALPFIATVLGRFKATTALH